MHFFSDARRDICIAKRGMFAIPVSYTHLELAHNITYMELSTDPSYMDEFVAACFIPHTNTALFPSVKQEEI